MQEKIFEKVCQLQHCILQMFLNNTKLFEINKLIVVNFIIIIIGYNYYIFFLMTKKIKGLVYKIKKNFLNHFFSHIFLMTINFLHLEFQFCQFRGIFIEVKLPAIKEIAVI